MNRRQGDEILGVVFAASFVIGICALSVAAHPTSSSPTFSATFSLTGFHGAQRGMNLTATTCALGSGSSWECDVTLWNQNYTTVKELAGLSYPANSSFFFAGANPTLDTPIAPHNQIAFQLWFTVLASSGSLHPNVVLRIGDA